MQLLPDVPLQLNLARWSRYLAAAVIAVAILVLLGWQLDIKEIRRPIPALVAMNPLTAVLFILSGVSFLLVAFPAFPGNKSVTALVFAAIVFFAALIKIISLFTDFGWQIDQFLYSGTLEKDIVGNISNRMAPIQPFAFCSPVFPYGCLM
ncbi:MAG: hypothetical protein WDO71_17925 [Bacteroidota bacterium]